jgi:hypothetical protein
MKNHKLLKLILNSSRNSERGSVLVIVTIVGAFTFAVLAIYMVFADNIQKFTEADLRNLNALTASSSALADRQDRVVAALIADPTALKNNTTLQSSTPFDCLRSVATNTGGTACNNFRPRATTLGQKYTLTEVTDLTTTDRYHGYTSVRDVTDYEDFATDKLRWTRLSAADKFAGLLAKSHVYTIGSLGIKQDNNLNTRAQTILESTIEVRQIPIFQFDRFAFGTDTLVFPAGITAISGRYHANGNLSLINDTGANLAIGGHWTVGNRLNLLSGNIYASLPGGLYLIPNAAPVAASDIYASTPTIATRDTGLRPLIVPSSELLKSRDSGGNLQSLYGKADLRIKRRDVNWDSGNINIRIPFEVESLQSGATANSGTCTDLAPDRENLATTKCRKFTKGMLQSLMGLVLAHNRGSTAEAAKYCPSMPTPNPVMANYSIATQDKILRALQLIFSAEMPNISLTEIESLTLDSPHILPLATVPTFADMLMAIGGITPADITVLTGAKAQEIAAARQSCFLTAPIQIATKRGRLYPYPWIHNIGNIGGVQNGLHDRRENKDFGAIQINMQSLSIWNRDGVFVETANQNLDFLASPTAADTMAALATNDTTDGYLWVRTAADATKPGTLAESGLGANSLIIHNDFEVGTTATNDIKAFIYNGGANLPAPTTVVSPAAIYLQGDWNNISKQPSAIMTDRLTILSNACLATTVGFLNGTYTIPKGQIGCGVSTTMNLASDTTINAAILSGVNPINATNRDSSPIRYLEDWTGKTLTMKSSFAINGNPLYSTSNFVAPGTGAYTPSEYFRYPTVNLSLDPDFADPAGLPPGTPMATQIHTNSIDRKFSEAEKENIQRILY